MKFFDYTYHPFKRLIIAGIIAIPLGFLLHFFGFTLESQVPKDRTYYHSVYGWALGEQMFENEQRRQNK